MKKHRLIKILFLILALGFVFWLSAGPGASIEKVTRPLPRVTTALVTRSNTSSHMRFSGMLRARQRATLSFSVPGRMQSRKLATGERVEQGQVVAMLDPAPFENALATARSRLAELSTRADQAGRDVERVTRLLASRAATREELEKVTAESDALQSSLAMARTSLAETERLSREAVLRAPFSGFVTEVLLEAGEFAPAGAPILSLSGSDHLEVEIAVQESILAALKAGSQVSLDLPFSGSRRVMGTIRTIGPASAGPGHLFPVIVDVDQAGADLVPGMTTELNLSLHNEAAMAIPVAAVVNPGGSNPGVWRVREGLVEKIPVVIGQLVEEQVTINGQLVSGDRVVTAGFSGLVSGERVEVVE